MISDTDLGMVETHPETETGHGQGVEISIEVILDKGTETEVTQEIGHGPEEETEGIEVVIDNIEVETGIEIIIEILAIGIKTTGDSRSNRGDRSRGNNRKGYNGYNNRRSNHCAGCNCNQRQYRGRDRNRDYYRDSSYRDKDYRGL